MYGLAVYISGFAKARASKKVPLALQEVRGEVVSPLERQRVAKAFACSNTSSMPEVADGAGGQTVAAGLITRELGLVQENHPGPGLGGLPCRRRARWPAAGNRQVVSLRHPVTSGFVVRLLRVRFYRTRKILPGVQPHGVG